MPALLPPAETIQTEPAPKPRRWKALAIVGVSIIAILGAIHA